LRRRRRNCLRYCGGSAFGVLLVFLLRLTYSQMIACQPVPRLRPFPRCRPNCYNQRLRRHQAQQPSSSSSDSYSLTLQLYPATKLLRLDMSEEALSALECKEDLKNPTSHLFSTESEQPEQQNPHLSPSWYPGWRHAKRLRVQTAMVKIAWGLKVSDVGPCDSSVSSAHLFRFNSSVN
jgi:hypothetical protein